LREYRYATKRPGRVIVRVIAPYRFMVSLQWRKHAVNGIMERFTAAHTHHVPACLFYDVSADFHCFLFVLSLRRAFTKTSARISHVSIDIGYNTLNIQQIL